MCSLSFSLHKDHGTSPSICTLVQALPSHFKLTSPFTRPSHDKTMVSIMIKILRCGTCRQSFETSPIELKLYSAIIYKFEWFSEFYTLAYQIMTSHLQKYCEYLTLQARSLYPCHRMVERKGV